MSFDNLCKLLSEKHPDRFATWILGQPLTAVKVLKTELSIEPIRADSLTLLQTQDRILHLEFQVKLSSDPPLPLRMLDYWVRLHRLYRVPITQVLILLCEPDNAETIETAFVLEKTRHEYQVLKMWEQDPSIFLEDEALLALAPLAAATMPERLLSQVAAQVSTIESKSVRQTISSYVQILAGLRFKKALIRQIFQEGMMRESVIYQDILKKGERKGKQEGKQEECLALVLRLLMRRLGTLERGVLSQVTDLPLAALEDLAEALLDFSTVTDLNEWLRLR